MGMARRQLCSLWRKEKALLPLDQLLEHSVAILPARGIKKGFTVSIHLRALYAPLRWNARVAQIY